MDPASLNYDQQEYLNKRIWVLELEAGIRSTLPGDIKQMIHRHLIPDAEPIDITRPENLVAPAYYTDPHAEFDYWRLTPFVFATDNIHDAVIATNAHRFVDRVLLNPTHMARFDTLDPPKQINYEILIRWDFVPHFLPEISLPNVESLFDLLHVLGGHPNRIRLNFLFKDIRVVYDRSPSSKKEIAPDNKGRLRIMKAKMLDLLQTAMMEYHRCLDTPSTVSRLQKWGRYMKHADATNPAITDADKYKKVRVWMADACSELLDRMWVSGSGRRAGFVKWHMLEAFGRDQSYYNQDPDVMLYVNEPGIPFLPLNKARFFP
ncbi:unnamed protein product [Aureobasidium mustum]|uniref:Uncharacterized protein n=1 Tax=Aureobasidium mustum TaxID=2773714 RepID=A0A9N8JVR4_9PEZI|nr:unnamed protein product [Aureobasidium mustum]